MITFCCGNPLLKLVASCCGSTNILELFGELSFASVCFDGPFGLPRESDSVYLKWTIWPPEYGEFCRGGNVHVLPAWFSFLESTIGIDNVHRRDGYTRVSLHVLICPGIMSDDL